MADLIPPVL